MKARAIVFEYSDTPGGVKHKITGEELSLQVRDIFEGEVEEILAYGIGMEAEEYIHHVHVEMVDAKN